MVSTWRKFDVYLHTKNRLHPWLPSFLRYCKFSNWKILQMMFQIFYFGYFEHVWLWTIKMILPACKTIRCLFSIKKYLSLTFFLKYYKDIANLLFWVHWGCLVTPKKTKSHQPVGDSEVYLQPKKRLDPSIFLEILHFK